MDIMGFYAASLQKGADITNDRACKAGPTQWCVFASYLSYPASQKMGKQIAMDGDDKLRMKCMCLHIHT